MVEHFVSMTTTIVVSIRHGRLILLHLDANNALQNHMHYWLIQSHYLSWLSIGLIHVYAELAGW